MPSGKIPWLGPNLFFFCYNCSIPLIKVRNCPICGKFTEKMKITPPYDARPATTYDIKQIQKLVLDNFGVRNFISPDDIILINNVGSEDRMDEIIYFGNSIGTKRYDLKQDKWIIRLNEYGLKMLDRKNISRKWVEVDKIGGKKIQEGANVLIPGILDADETIKKGDYIVILNNKKEVIAGGIAREDDIIRKKKDKGVYAKNYQSVTLKTRPKYKKNSWNEIIKANVDLLEDLEAKAINYIRKTVSEIDLPFFVSYSGGKDSLVTLFLVKQAFPNIKFPIVFIDTGIEFPETVKHVKASIKKLKMQKQLIMEKVSPEIFWKAFEKFGPPGRDYRYCCKFAKLAPIKRIISKLYSNEGKCLSFVGQRRYESYIRASEDMWTNPYIPEQINASPIQDWNAYMIWLYIYWKNLPYLGLYDRGYERIGCWLCPSSDIAHLELLKKNHPKYYVKLKNKVKVWGKENCFPDFYWEKGLWRFKDVPKKILNVVSLSKEEKEKLRKKTYELTSLKFIKENNEKKIITGELSKVLDLTKIRSSITIIEKIQEIQELANHHLIFETNDYTITIHISGTFEIEINATVDQSKITNFLITFLITLFRSMECTSCGLCVQSCPTQAIKIDRKENQLIIDKEKCSHCHKCFEYCPIVTIIHDNLGRKIYKMLWK